MSKSQKSLNKWDLVITPHRRWFDLNLSEILSYKDLLLLFVKRDFTTFINKQYLDLSGFFFNH